MAKTTKPDAAEDSPFLVFQVLGNVTYSREGLAKSWRDGEYLQFSLEEFGALPDVLKSRLKALDTVQIKKG
jgi:hypothetical protein